jgi:Domain of unknown function (DUF4326)
MLRGRTSVASELMPSRIQRQRSRGWQQPINSIYVGRPTKWGNPYKVGPGHHTVDEAVTLYCRDLITGSLPFSVEDVIRELRGKDLVCWCKLDALCHADVLLAVANRNQAQHRSNSFASQDSRATFYPKRGLF